MKKQLLHGAATEKDEEKVIKSSPFFATEKVLTFVRGLLSYYSRYYSGSSLEQSTFYLWGHILEHWKHLSLPGTFLFPSSTKRSFVFMT